MSAGAGAVVRQGHLRKLKTMKKKYFVLRAETAECSARLEYYESEKKFRSGASPRRVLPLKSCYNITRRLDLKQKHVIALFTREEQFCIVAENELDLHAWLTAILKQHRNEDASEELLHPTQHVWQVNVQKKGLGATKNIQGLYNLCLTDKTLTLVKIKSQNNVISDLGIPERVEYSLKNIRRCGDSECFFYMEVGRQTATGAGELWMHSDDSNIAQSMHSTIYHAMRNCAKETENERDHIIIPKGSSAEGSTLPSRPRTYSIDGRGRAGVSNDKGLCVGSCIRQCVCATTYSVDDSGTAFAPLASKNAENQPPNNSLTLEHKETPPQLFKHHRTVSLPIGCALFQEPLKIVHERTRSDPLTGDEVDRAIIEKSVTHSSCKAVNGTDVFAKKSQWSRRASTGARLSKLSPAHAKNAGTLRNRCDSMPSRACSSFEAERPPRHADSDGGECARDEPDAAEWHRTPRIPEEPDFCDPIRELISSSLRSVQHSRTSSTGPEEEAGYLPMAPSHDPPGLVSASSGSVCSGTPSTDPRFSEYQLEPATSHIVDAERPPRAYSVGSRPPPRADPPRHRACSLGAKHRPGGNAGGPGTLGGGALRHAHAVCSAPLLPRASADDLMELDFSANSPAAKVMVARTPPAPGFADPRRPEDEYVDMSPRNAGYVEMRPGDIATPSRSPPAPATPDGYVEMNYGRAPTRPIEIAAPRGPPPPPLHSPPEGPRRLREARTPLGSQTIFPISLDSPASPPEVEADVLDEETRPLSTVREISEEARDAASPAYVKLAYRPPRADQPDDQRVAPPETVTLVLASSGAPPARFSVGDESPPLSPGGPVSPAPAVPLSPAPGGPPPLNYAALDLEPRRAGAQAAPPAYTQIDFARSEKLHVADN